MTRFATPADIQNITSLWVEAFGDTLQYIESFISTLGNPSNCLIIERDNTILSMAFLLPCRLTTPSGLRDAFYIYAMCTAKNEQGKGFATSLLNDAYRHAKEKNALAIILVPATAALAEYYQLRGYIWLYAKPKFVIQDENNAKTQRLEKRHYPRIVKTMEFLQDIELSVIWPLDHIEFALNQKTEEGTLVSYDQNGYKLIESDSQTVIETIPLPQDWRSDTNAAMIRFCEPYPLHNNISPYFNWGLE